MFYNLRDKISPHPPPPVKKVLLTLKFHVWKQTDRYSAHLKVNLIPRKLGLSGCYEFAYLFTSHKMAHGPSGLPVSSSKPSSNARIA